MDPVAQWLRRWSDLQHLCPSGSEVVEAHQSFQVRVLAGSAVLHMYGVAIFAKLQLSKESLLVGVSRKAVSKNQTRNKKLQDRPRAPRTGSPGGLEPKMATVQSKGIAGY